MSRKIQRRGDGGGASRIRTGDGIAAGKRTRTESMVQRKPAGGPQAEDVQRAAEQGTRGTGGALPHGDAIQRSFGRHDVSAIQAHTDAAASESAHAMGAEAYATGDHVAFAGAPSLHTAAHEAAHVVQQRGGVQLKGGVGEVGDRYEQHADDVADRVVRGESAEDLLDPYAGGGGGAGVQRKVGLEFETNVPVRKLETGKDGKQTERRLGYKEPIFGSAGWTGEGDASKVEFVTDPMSDRGTVAGVMDDIVDTATTMSAKLAEMAPKRPLTRDLGFPDDNFIFGTGSAMTILASPQATGGVPVEDLPNMIPAIRTTQLPHLKDNKALSGTAIPKSKQNLSGMSLTDGDLLSEGAGIAKSGVQSVIDQLREQGKEPPDLRRLEGLLALVIGYLLKGARQAHVWKYSKLIAPLMSRVNFSALYETMSKDEKRYFTMANISAITGLAADEAVFAKGFGEEAEGTDPGDVDKGPTRREWVDSIIARTVDKMSYRGGTKVAGGNVGKDGREIGNSGSSSGLGSMTDVDHDESGLPLAVLELRRLPKHQDFRLWKHTALAVYDFFAQFDETLQEKPKPAAEATPEVSAPASTAPATASDTPAS